MADQQSFLGTLSAVHASNWDLCKAHGLWGSGSSSHAKHAAGQIRAGDLLYVWRSKEGLFALAEFLAPAASVAAGSLVPWPSPERYLHTYRIRPLVELDQPVGDTFDNHVSTRFGLRTHQLQAGLIKLDEAQADPLARLFQIGPHDGVTEAEGPPEPAEILHTTTDVLERPLGTVYLHPAVPLTTAMLELWRSGQLSPDREGTLLVVGDESQMRDFEAELTRPPFASVADQFRFVTPEQLADELRTQLSG